MLDPRRSILQHGSSMAELPRIDALTDLYAWGWKPRHSELMMISGRSGSGKSTLALFLAAKMKLPCLYFSADMTPSQITYKLAAMELERDSDELEAAWQEDSRSHDEILGALADQDFMFSFGAITLDKIDSTLDAWVEMFDTWPAVIVIDNLMDMESAESDYHSQVAAMQYLHEMKTNTGSTVIVLHHASEGGEADPYSPPARRDIKNKITEKPEQVLTVGLNPNKNEFRIAPVKQRMGRSDPTGHNNVAIRAIPSQSRFEPIRERLLPMYHAESYKEGDADA